MAYHLLGHWGRRVSVKKVLIVEDNQQIRMLVRAALRPCGCEIVESCDGEDAIEAAVAERPDLVLLDVMMPKMDGFEVLRFLRSHPETRDCRVVMLTAATATADRESAEQGGADGYVVKPFEPGLLRETVMQHLATGADETD